MKRIALVLFGMMILGGALAVAQTMQHQHPMAPAGEKAGMMDCQAMMAKQQEMETRMAEMDARLQQLVDQMNAARGSSKVDRMAAVLTEMVAQRKQMREQMAAMPPMMMQHMMQHLHHSMMKGMGEGMAGCPMMKKGSM